MDEITFKALTTSKCKTCNNDTLLYLIDVDGNCYDCWDKKHKQKG